MVPLRTLAVALLLAASLAPLPATTAQATSTTWYMHAMTTPDGAGSYLDFVAPADEADQTATCTACAAGAPYVTHSEAQAPLATAMRAVDGDASALVYYKSWNNGPAPSTTVTVTVTADGAPIATGSLTQDVLLGEIVEFAIPLTFTAEVIEAGAVIAMDSVAELETCGCYNPFAYPRGVSADHPWSFTLPVVPDGVPAPGPGAIYEDILDAEVALTVEEADPVTETRVYNWTTDLTAVTIAHALELSAGNLTFSVQDGSGQSIAGDALSESAEGAADLDAVVPGNWTLTVALDGFSGSFALGIVGLAADGATGGDGGAVEDGATPGSDGDTNTAIADSNDGGGVHVDAGGDDKGSPGVMAPMLLLALAALAFVRRR